MMKNFQKWNTCGHIYNIKCIFSFHIIFIVYIPFKEVGQNIAMTYEYSRQEPAPHEEQAPPILALRAP